MSGFLDKFNDCSEGRFSFLRLSKVNVFAEDGCLEFCFVCPEEHFALVSESLSQIERAVERAFSTSLNIKVRVKNSHFDPHFFARDIIGFFDSFPSLRGSVTKRSFIFASGQGQALGAEGVANGTEIESEVAVEAFDELGNFGGCEGAAGVVDSAGNSVESSAKKDDAVSGSEEIHGVRLRLLPTAYGVFESRGLSRRLMDFVRSNYCESIDVKVERSDEIEEIPEECEEKYSFERGAGRCIEVTSPEGLIGFTVFDAPAYISDAAPAELATLCGKIGQLKEIERKPKDGVVKPSFYKFTLDDTTGVINCVYFPSDKTKVKFACLTNDTEIVAQGKLEINTFNDQSALTFYIRRISYCTLPKDFTVNRLKLNVPTSYKNVFPHEYIELVQTSLFGESDGIEGETLGGKRVGEAIDDKSAGAAKKSCSAKNKLGKSNADSGGDADIDRECVGGNFNLGDSAAVPDIACSETIDAGVVAGGSTNSASLVYSVGSAPINKFLRDRQFCVFDIETTGLDRLNDKIIEIGAAKVVNGRITHTFSSFIDPEVPLPEKIIKLTGITDRDLKDAHLIGEVLPDLLKFMDGTILVGHNLELFDYPFLANAARKFNIYFDNKRLDTYVLAREYLKLDQYRLKDLAVHYDVINPNAHRALDDAITTAKIFILMSDLFDFEV